MLDTYRQQVLVSDLRENSEVSKCTRKFAQIRPCHREKHNPFRSSLQHFRTTVGKDKDRFIFQRGWYL